MKKSMTKVYIIIPFTVEPYIQVIQFHSSITHPTYEVGWVFFPRIRSRDRQAPGRFSMTSPPLNLTAPISTIRSITGVSPVVSTSKAAKVISPIGCCVSIIRKNRTVPFSSPVQDWLTTLRYAWHEERLVKRLSVSSEEKKQSCAWRCSVASWHLQQWPLCQSSVVMRAPYEPSALPLLYGLST